MATKQKTIELALQGGGSHGALTWGVLDRLLDEDDIQIEGISGTSAGAMNAVVLADGFEEGGRRGAQISLEKFWKSVSDGAKNSPFQRDIWSRINGTWSLDNSPSYLFFDHLSRVLSPYELNPLNLNPLRDLIEKQIDFKRVNRCKAIKLFVTATNVRTGRPKVFSQPDISVDSMLASAALPFMFQAVEIDGEAYWDGGYTGNPALYPLVDECAARDLILVQINPFYRNELPTNARDIINRLNEITFNASLIKELRSINLLKDLIQAEDLAHEEYRDMRLHCIHGEDDLWPLEASSKLNAEWEYLCYLKDLGRTRTNQWLVEHKADIGERTTFNPEWLLEGSFKSVEKHNRCK